MKKRFVALTVAGAALASAAVVSAFAYAGITFDSSRKDGKVEQDVISEGDESVESVLEMVQTDVSVWYDDEGNLRYPVTEEDAIWTQLSMSQAFTVTNMPLSIAQDLETSELLEMFFEYPFSTDFLAFNDSNNGFETIRSRCNVLNVLMERDDLYDVLVEYDTSFADSESSEYDFMKAETWRGLIDYVISACDLDDAQIETLEDIRTYRVSEED